LKLNDFAQGDYVYERLGCQNYSLSDASPLSAYLGIVGVLGFFGYFGMLDIAKPQAGKTVVVSAAAGAVGMVAGKIAKRQGANPELMDGTTVALLTP